MQDQLNDAIKNLNNAANNPTNTALQNQLTAANAALAAASKKQNQMAKAFVPQANPNALVSAGTTNSANSSARPAQSNQLSDLTILSGLGTTSNPLAGLQLA
jgi:predicted flap endonuclease-1-like 5' DNA nuclease